MNNIQAAETLINLYGAYRSTYGYQESESYAQAIAMACGALCAASRDAIYLNIEGTDTNNAEDDEINIRPF